MEKNDQLFMQLLYLFHQTSMQSLGKVKNPLTDKIERNMEQAQHAIDLMEMLKEKTKGNISADLTKILDGFLTEMRLNYIDEVNKDKEKTN